MKIRKLLEDNGELVVTILGAITIGLALVIITLSGGQL